MSEGNLNIENGVLKKYDGDDKNIVIPSSVTKIGEGAFKDSEIETITFEGNALKSIESEAFYGCTNLQNIRLPKNVVNIGDRAFYGCKSMIYIEIPASVLIVGEDILGECEKIKFVLGEQGSEAEKIASQHKFVLKNNASEAITALKNSDLAKKTKQTRSFVLWGETIICSNTLAKYEHNLEYYADRKESLFERFFSMFPKSISDKFGDLVSVLHAEQDNTISRLSKQGVFIDRQAFAEYLLKPYEAILEASTAIKNVYDYIAQGVESGIANNREALLNEAESKITGLSYGIIGGGIDMLAYSVDDYRERERQRQDAYEYAEKKATEFKEMHTKNGNDLYSALIAVAAPALHTATDMFLDALCQAENEQLIRAGLIDEEAINNIDIAKSNQLLDSIVAQSGDQTFTLALALKKYPCNISAFAYALQKDYVSNELQELMDFLGIRDTVNRVIQIQKREAHNALIEKIGKEIEAKTINDSIVVLKHNESKLQKNEVIQFLRTLTTRVGLEIERVVYDVKTIKSGNIDYYCRKALNHIITDESWKYFEKNGIRPIESTLIPIAYQQNMDSVLEWMIYVATALSQHPELPGKFEAEEKLNRLRSGEPIAEDKMYERIFLASMVLSPIAFLKGWFVMMAILVATSIIVINLYPSTTQIRKLEQDLETITEITKSIEKVKI